LGAVLCLFVTSLAHADRDKWPELWRGHEAAELSEILDAAYVQYEAERRGGRKHDARVIALAIAPLKQLLEDRERKADTNINDPALGRGWMFLGELQTLLGDYHQALYAQQFGLSKLKLSIPIDSSEFADTLASLGRIYARLAKYEEAISLYEQALAHTEKAEGPENRRTGDHLTALARLHMAVGQYAKALPLLERALDISEKVYGPKNLYTAGCLNELANFYVRMGRYEQALPLFKRALANTERLRVLSYERDKDGYLNDLANLYMRMGRFEQALPLYERALAIVEKSQGPKHPITGLLLENLARVYLAMGNYELALPLFERALYISEKTLGPEHPTTGRRLNNLAQIYCGMNRCEQALPLFRRAAQVAESAGDPNLLWTTLSNMMMLHSGIRKGAQSFHQLDLAILYGKQAVNVLQSMRGEMRGLDKELQNSFAEKNRRPYEFLANLLLREGRIDEAQVVLQMLKEQELTEAFERSAATNPPTTRIELTGLERKTFAEFYELRERQAALGQEKRQLAAKDKDGSLSNAERTRLKEIDTKLVPQIQAGVERFMAGLQERLQQQRKSGEKVRDLEATEARLRKAVIELDKKDPESKAVALQFVTTDDTVSILLTTPGVPPIVRQVPMQRKALNDLINQVKMRLQGRADRALLDPQLRQLYALLIAPVEADLKTSGARTLMLSPNGVLRYVPFAALLNGQRFLVQDYTLALYTEGVASLSFESTAKRDWRLAGLGLTQEVKGARGDMLSALPNVKDELSSVLHQPRVTGQAWLDADFDRNRLGSTLRGNFNVLHVASHFEFISGRPDASSLYLGDKSSLSLAEVALQDMRFDNFDLVNFSACETAVGGGKDEYGQELESLGAKVLQQGAGAVMATLWKVADKSTPRLMQAFYKARGDSSLNKAQALRQAQLAFISGDIRFTQEKTWDHPYYWAPFVLMGNWR
jgi:CHAT domain-containing protein/Tfp pilus assembly protein PilF